MFSISLYEMKVIGPRLMIMKFRMRFSIVFRCDIFYCTDRLLSSLKKIFKNE